MPEVGHTRAYKEIIRYFDFRALGTSFPEGGGNVTLYRFTGKFSVT